MNSREETAATLAAIADNKELLEVARQEIERALIDFRDGFISELNRGNGLVIRRRNGEPSDIIRFGPEAAMCIGLKAIAEHLKLNG